MTTNWAARFMQMAELVATWSKDPSTKVGAVITDDKHRIVSVGFNGVPRGVMEPNSREQKLHRTIHAEQNAMAFAGRDLTGCRIYVTHAPCAQCAAMIAQRGIAMVCFDVSDKQYIERWEESVNEGIKVLNEARIIILPFEGNK